MNDVLRGKLQQPPSDLWRFSCSCDPGIGQVSKEVVGIHVLLNRSLYGDGTPHRSLRRVSLAKPTSAPLRFWWLCRKKPQFELHQHPKTRATHRGAGKV